MKAFMIPVFFVCVLAFSGCTGFVITTEEAPGTSRQALQNEERSCKDVCMERFHQCRASGRSRGPGKSGCAHEKNRCQRSC